MKTQLNSLQLIEFKYLVNKYIIVFPGTEFQFYSIIFLRNRIFLDTFALSCVRFILEKNKYIPNSLAE